jgi:FkbM family methyltransferase
MAGDLLPRMGLWMYRHAERSGLLASRPARSLYEIAYGRYKRHVEDPFFNLTRRHPELFEGGHIVDVGANIGYTSVVFAAAIRPGFQIWAFEPASANVRRLQAVIEDRRLQSIVCIRRAAVSDRRGTIDLVLNPDNPADHRLPSLPVFAPGDRPTERVPLTTIDDEVRDGGIAPVSFVKIDVQGSELRVCRGMTKTLEDNPSAAIVVEFAPALLRTYGDDPDQLPRFFADRGYTAFRVTQRGSLEPMAAVDFRDDLPPPGYIDVLFTRPHAERRG